jgi:hypothetical protein
VEPTRTMPTPENVVVLRQVNETVCEAARGDGAIALTLLCECGGDYCAEDVQMTEREHRVIREAEGCRAVAPGHVRETERVVARRRAYWVVEALD